MRMSRRLIVIAAATAGTASTVTWSGRGVRIIEHHGVMPQPRHSGVEMFRGLTSRALGPGDVPRPEQDSGPYSPLSGSDAGDCSVGGDWRR